jgi:putative transposase
LTRTEGYTALTRLHTLRRYLIQDARAFCQVFFAWYNTEHRHGGLGLLTPHDVHYGLAEQRRAARATVLAAAYAAHPERFPRGVPQPATCPNEVWINPPQSRATKEALRH